MDPSGMTKGLHTYHVLWLGFSEDEDSQIAESGFQ